MKGLILGLVTACVLSVSAQNLMKNSDFTAPIVKGRVPAWNFWQAKGSKGTFTVDPKGNAGKPAGVIKNCQSGCIFQSVAVKTGEKYTFSMRASGPDGATIMVRYQDAAHQWTKGIAEPKTAFGKPGQDGWRDASITLTVPAKVAYIIPMFNSVNGKELKVAGARLEKAK